MNGAQSFTLEETGQLAGAIWRVCKTKTADSRGEGEPAGFKHSTPQEKIAVSPQGESVSFLSAAAQQTLRADPSFEVPSPTLPAN